MISPLTSSQFWGRKSDISKKNYECISRESNQHFLIPIGLSFTSIESRARRHVGKKCLDILCTWSISLTKFIDTVGRKRAPLGEITFGDHSHALGCMIATFRYTCKYSLVLNGSFCEWGTVLPVAKTCAILYKYFYTWWSCMLGGLIWTYTKWHDILFTIEELMITMKAEKEIKNECSYFRCHTGGYLHVAVFSLAGVSCCFGQRAINRGFADVVPRHSLFRFVRQVKLNTLWSKALGSFTHAQRWCWIELAVSWREKRRWEREMLGMCRRVTSLQTHTSKFPRVFTLH